MQFVLIVECLQPHARPARRGMRAAADSLPRSPPAQAHTNSPVLWHSDQLGAAAQVVAATNIAETSVTIPGITYVIDSCFVKARRGSAERAGARPQHAGRLLCACAPCGAAVCLSRHHVTAGRPAAATAPSAAAATYPEHTLTLLSCICQPLKHARPPPRCARTTRCMAWRRCSPRRSAARARRSERGAPAARGPGTACACAPRPRLRRCRPPRCAPRGNAPPAPLHGGVPAPMHCVDMHVVLLVCRRLPSAAQTARA